VTSNLPSSTVPAKEISNIADDDVQVILDNRLMSIAKPPPPKENVQWPIVKPEIAVLPVVRSCPAELLRPEYQTPIPAALLFHSKPELQVSPMQTGRQQRNYCQRKTSYSMTKVAMSSKTCNEIHQQFHNFHSNGNQVIQLRNYRKIAIGPQMNPVNVVPTVFYPPDMSAHRFQHRPPALPMLPPIPMLEPIPVRRQLPPPTFTTTTMTQMNQYPPVPWMSKPVPQPIPGEAANQIFSQGSDKRDGSYYRSAKQFILTDDAKNTFSLFAH
jgi:hypothetical protein